MTDKPDDHCEKIASDINTFLGTVGAPAFLRVKAENVEIVGTGARIRAVFGDAIVSIELGSDSLTHLAMMSGVFQSFGR